MYIVLIPTYIMWHYTRGYIDLFVVQRNIGRAIMRIFSLELLITTLFAPFERLGESYARGKISMWFETLTVNLLMRAVGIIVRLSVISVGLFTLLLWVIVSACVFVVWAILPVIIIGLLYFGVLNLVKAL